MKFWHWVFFTGVLVITALLVQREFMTPVIYTDEYKEKYERTLDSLEQLRIIYDLKLAEAATSIDSLNNVLDSLQKEHNKITKQYSDLIEDLEFIPEEEVVEQFYDYTDGIYDDKDAGKIVVSINNLRGAVKLFHERDWYNEETNILTRQVNNYKDLVWNYQVSLELHKEKEKVYKETISESYIYQNNLRVIIEEQNKDIFRLQNRTTRILTIGGAVILGTVLIAL